MPSRKAGIAAALVLLAAAVSWWWMRPERQIRAMLDDVAAAFTHDGTGNGLESLTAVAALRPLLAPEVAIEIAGSVRIDGRDEALGAAARVRARAQRLRVRFFDPDVTVTGDAATVTVTSEVATGTPSGEDLIDVHHVTATLHRTANRWVVSSASLAPRPGD